MQIEFLGHSAFKVATQGETFLTDPWFNPLGAYLASWFQFPENHHLGSSAASGVDYLYVSHFHADHLDLAYLGGLPLKFKSAVTVLLPGFHVNHVERGLRSIGFQKFQTLAHNEEVETPAGNRLMVMLEETPFNADSALVLSDGSTSFLNSNDCKLTIAQQEYLLSRFGPIDCYTEQFSGASWHPTCYEYDPAQQSAEAAHKRTTKFRRIQTNIERLGCSSYLTSGGPPVFLDPSLAQFNDATRTIFAQAPAFLASLTDAQRRIAHYAYPGDRFDLANGSLKPETWLRERFDPATPAGYIDDYRARRAPELLAELERLSANPWPPEVLRSRLVEHFADKMALSPALTRSVGLTLEVSVSVPDFNLWVDFPGQRVRVDGPPGWVGYRLRCEGRWLQLILAGEIGWEDLLLSLRFSLWRDPDVYNEALIAYLKLRTADEMEDYLSYRERLANRKSRVRRRYGGETIEYDQYCPHASEDLACAHIEAGVLTCPRHGWRFSLKDGAGINNTYSIGLKHLG